MIQIVKSIDKDVVSEEEKLEKFFLVLSGQFNYGKPLDKEFRNRVTNFLNFRWQNNRNNFMLTDID